MFGLFRKPRSSVTGVSTDATMVPVEMLREFKQVAPLDIAVSGTGSETWTLNASVTRPVFLWNGDDYTRLTETRAYTFAATGNSILSSSGVVGTANDAAGVWYMYLKQSGSALIASQTGPSYVEGPYQSGYLGHPGTARAAHYRYVGFHSCSSATTPLYRAFTKIGYDYLLTAVSATLATTWAEIDFSTSVPKLGHLGGLIGGYLETGADGIVVVGSHSASTRGIQRLSVVAATLTNVAFAPFAPLPMTAAGKIYANYTTAAGDIHITMIRDVV